MEDPNVSPIKRRRKDIHVKQALEGLDEGFTLDQIQDGDKFNKTSGPTEHHCILTDKVNSITVNFHDLN